MKFLYHHLKVKASTPEETARILSTHVQEVEDVSTEGILATGVFTGKIIDVQTHPNADKLRIVSIDFGDEVLDIVTGAPNVEVGQIIPVAKVGARVRAVNHHSDAQTVTSNEMLEIKPVTLRGIESRGMVCGADELGLSNTVEMGVYIFPNETPLGVPVESLIESKAIIETDDKGTAHRPDLLSYRGVEQELAALLKQPFERHYPHLPEATGDLSITIEANDACELFLAARIDQFTTMESPAWLKQFITDHGLNVINLPTDVTNYVMLTEGGATHAFGGETVNGNKLTVRFAHNNETIKTLNNREYHLTSTDLVIADSHNVLDIAGIIGGSESCVTEHSESIILTSIVIDSATVRRTSRKHSIRTEASSRRERGQTVGSSVNAFVMILNMLSDIAGAKVRAFNYAGNIDHTSTKITLNAERMNKFLSTSLTIDMITDILKRLNYNVTHNGTTLIATPPWWRSDIQTAADVYEDIARIYGYNNISSQVRLLPNSAVTGNQEHVLQILRKAASEIMYEVETSSMVESVQLGSFEVANPIGTKKHIRQSLLPELFKLAEHFVREGHENYACFEIGNTYRQEENRISEKVRFGACIVDDVESAKSRIARILHRLHINIEEIEFELCDQSEDRIIKYDAVAHITYKNTLLGSMCVNKKRGKLLCGFKLYVEALTHVANLNPKYASYARFPSAKRDSAFIISNTVSYAEIIKLIQKQSPLINSIQLFDEFNDKEMASGHHSLAFHLTFQSHERTLKDDEINAIMNQIQNELIKQYDVKIRE